MGGLLAELANCPKSSPPAQSFRLVPAEAFASFFALEGAGLGVGLLAGGLGSGVFEVAGAGLLACWALHSNTHANELQNKRRMPMARIVRRDLNMTSRVKQRLIISRKINLR